MAASQVLVLICVICQFSHIALSASVAGKVQRVSKPVVVNTWNFPVPARRAYDEMQTGGKSAVEAVVLGCGECDENPALCGWSVGYGAKPDESGETTLDAMIMNGATMEVGAVGHLRHVKQAIGVAHAVMKYTEHTMIVGSLATEFAQSVGFEVQNLSTPDSIQTWNNWRSRNCQPNFRRNVLPDPATNCGPYVPYDGAIKEKTDKTQVGPKPGSELNHDTIGMVAIDQDGNIASGTSTNGLTHKVPGRVGDSPIPGAGSYADNDVGAAAATGNGDIMMRFSPSFLTVELMRYESTPAIAASIAISRISRHYPEFSGGIIAVNANGDVGAACHNMANGFPFTVMSSDFNEPQLVNIPCSS